MRRFWRGLLIFIFGGILGTGFGFALGILVFPYLFPPPPAAEQMTEADVYEKTVFLEPDFEVGPGPKYHVYLVPKANVRTNADVPDTMFVDLGRLRAFKGSQRYEVPAGVDLRKYQSVVIWCETFGVLISPADLKPAS
jgi:hypothetical protein